MDKSFDPTHTVPCVDVQESHDKEINEGAGGLLSDHESSTAYSHSTLKISSYLDNRTKPTWESASFSGGGPVSERNLVVSG